ncbi:MAG: AmmeMemoRadiSam system protein B [Bacteroidia bacterium]
MPLTEQILTRQLIDKVGFAHTLSQMEAVMERIEKQQGNLLRNRREEVKISPATSWKTAICPHDDYTYTGYLYPLVLRQVKTPIVFIVAVAHKAAMYNLENNLIFDDFTHWHGIRNPIPVSPLREKLLEKLPKGLWQVHRQMQQTEHSVESMLPFLQYFNPGIEIVPILVPFMPFDRMLTLSDALAIAIKETAIEKKMEWGKDFSILITTDAVHYGNEDWSGRNCDRFGVDEAGYKKAFAFEHQLIDECFTGKITPERIKGFYGYTVSSTDFHQYKWTWCGRYSVPVGLLTTIKLAEKLQAPVPKGILLDYSTSLEHEHIPVKDLDGMGITAEANLRHWVGYAGLGYI